MSDEPEPGSAADIERALRILGAQPGDSVHGAAWRVASQRDAACEEAAELRAVVETLRIEVAGGGR